MTWLFWALLSASFAAATAILAKIGIAGVDSNLATAIRTTVILVFTWAIAIGLDKHHGLAEIGRKSWFFLVLSGIATGFSWLCYFRALQMGPASKVAPIDKLSVVVVIVCAWLFLGEKLTLLKVAGRRVDRRRSHSAVTRLTRYTVISSLSAQRKVGASLKMGASRLRRDCLWQRGMPECGHP